jgi:hypothetical protein
MMKSMRMRSEGHVARMVEKRNAYRVFDGKSRRKRRLGRTRRRGENNIKMGLRNIGWSDMDWVHSTQDTDQWRLL